MKTISPGKNPPEEINVLVEIPQGSSIKYEIDEETGAVFVDRFLYTAFSYPFNYGSIPGTQAGDGDPVDVLVLCDKTVQVGSVIPSVPIGMLEMEDEAGTDTKIIAVPTKKVDPDWGAYQDISEISEAIKNKIKHFFEHYKELEPGKWVKVKDWKGKKEALLEVKKGLKNE